MTSETPSTIATTSAFQHTTITVGEPSSSYSGENHSMTHISIGIIGAVVGAAVAIIIMATVILCVAIVLLKKKCNRRSSVNLTSSSEKSPNRDGYVNALYDSKLKNNITSHKREYKEYL